MPLVPLWYSVNLWLTSLVTGAPVWITVEEDKLHHLDMSRREKFSLGLNAKYELCEL